MWWKRLADTKIRSRRVVYQGKFQKRTPDQNFQGVGYTGCKRDGPIRKERRAAGRDNRHNWDQPKENVRVGLARDQRSKNIRNDSKPLPGKE